MSLKPIHADVDYIKFGEGVSKNFGFTRRVVGIITVGMGLGMVWKVRVN